MEVEWNHVVRDLGPRLFRYFTAQFGNSELSDELVQEVLIRLVRKVEADEYDIAKGNFAMFAFGIAYFVKLEHMRGRRAQLESVPLKDGLEAVDSAKTPEAALSDRQQAHHFRKALHELGDIQREAILLYIDDELTLDQIAAILEQPLNTIKSHIHRAKIILKAFFSQEKTYE